MEKLGFHSQWIEMIMSCVSSVKYRVRYNSQETEEFIPTRGIRQGDSLSPICFSYAQKIYLACCSLKKNLVALSELECA